MSLGDLARLDWHRAQVGDSQPCTLCGHGTILRHPITLRPCHKVCSDHRRNELIENAARQTTKGKL